MVVCCLHDCGARKTRVEESDSWRRRELKSYKRSPQQLRTVTVCPGALSPHARAYTYSTYVHSWDPWEWYT